MTVCIAKVSEANTQYILDAFKEDTEGNFKSLSS